MKNILLTLLIFYGMQNITNAQLVNPGNLPNHKHNGLQSFSLYNVAFTVSNIDNSIKWYQDIFGFKLLSRSIFSVPAGSAEAAIIEGGGLRLELVHVPDGKRIDEMFAEVPKHLIPVGNKFIVLQVNDVAMASKELEEKGVTFVWREQHLVGNSMLCTMILDIDGNKINIFQSNSIIGNEKLDEPIDAERIAEEHLLIWNEIDETARGTAISKLYSDNVQFIDPNLTSNGFEKLNGFITKLKSEHPGYVIKMEGKVVTHHNTIKFNWNYGNNEEPKKITGTDVMIVENGKIKSLYVFVNDL